MHGETHSQHAENERTSMDSSGSTSMVDETGNGGESLVIEAWNMAKTTAK